MTRLRITMLAVAIALANARAGATDYQVTDIGVFAQGIEVTGINNFSHAIGVIGGQSAFVWKPDSGFSYLNVLSGYTRSIPNGINSGGWIAGVSEYNGSHTQACVWDPSGSLVGLGALPSGQFTQGSIAYGVNDSQQVVGSSVSELGYDHAFVWTQSGGMVDISSPGDSANSYAYAVNNEGTAVGERAGRAFTWTASSGVVDLGQFGLGSTAGIDINSAGQILLNSYSAAVYNEGFVWEQATGARSIGMLPGGQNTYTVPYDLNDVGQVVGRSNGQPFIWSDAGSIQPLPLIPGHQYGSASAINDYGVIAGYSVDSSGARHLLLWTPIPEPSSLLALGGGLAALGLSLFRRIRSSH